MFFAVRTVFGTSNGAAIAIVCLSWIPLAAAVLLWAPLRFLLGWLASPFFLFYAFYYLRGEFGNIRQGLRQRQNFRRMLDAAAVNPHDAEAQYQLGLIYQERRQYTEAVRRFTNAIAIDPEERTHISNWAGLRAPLRDGSGTQSATSKPCSTRTNVTPSEILRELGGVYVTARQYADARKELADYIERRPYDPEGLFCCCRTESGGFAAAEGGAGNVRASGGSGPHGSALSARENGQVRSGWRRSNCGSFRGQGLEVKGICTWGTDSRRSQLWWA